MPRRDPAACREAPPVNVVRKVEAGEHAGRPRGEEHHPGADPQRLVDAVGDQEDCLAGLLPDPDQLVQRDLAVLRVECTEGLVHQQDLWLDRQNPRDRGALLHPTGEARRVVVLKAGDPHELQLARCSLPGRGARHAAR